jgi:hypothetical protein
VYSFCLGQGALAASYEEANEISGFVQDEKKEELNNVIL